MSGAKRIVAAAIFVILALFAHLAVSEGLTERFIICNPDSYVNVRKTPKNGGEVIGQLYCGDAVLTDGKEKNGYLHCVDMSNEYGEGWVHEGYVINDKPEIVESYGVISSNGRVAVRRWINGKRGSWIRDGTRVKVLAVSEEWALTVRGFVKTKYLGVER